MKYKKELRVKCSLIIAISFTNKYVVNKFQRWKEYIYIHFCDLRGNDSIKIKRIK